MVHGDDGVVAGLLDVLEPGDLEPEKARNTIERKSISQLVGKVRAMMTVTTRLAAPISPNSSGMLKPSFCSRPKHTAPTTMKAALSTLTAATTRAR